MKDGMNTQIGAVRSAMADAIRLGTLNAGQISGLMSQAFGGSDAGGAWEWRQAYDLMQSAALDVLTARVGGQSFERILAAAQSVAASLPTETRRSERQMQLQQFSTALPWAVVAAFAGAARETDIILEPSAGTGSLLRAALLGERKLRGKAAPKLHANEIDSFRAAILRESIASGSITTHDAEFIDDLLITSIAPSLILMNPPFASSASRSDDPTIALRHAISAAKRLAIGGRLVAILPPSASPERQPDLWRRFAGQVQPIARLVLPRSAFAKIGTTIETHLVVAEKIIAGQEHTAQHQSVRMVQSPEEAMELLADVLPERAETREITVHSAPARRTLLASVVSSSISPKGMILPKRSPVVLGIGQATVGMGLAITALDTPKVNEAISEVYARYHPQRLTIEGAMPHPTTLVESLAMASVAPPMPDTGLAPV